MPGLTYRGVLAGDGDTQDYYWLEMGGAGRLEVWLDAIPAGQNDDLVLRDAALNQVDYSGELDSRDEYIDTEEILPPGRYYIQVYQRSGGGSPEPYALCYAVR